jgi:hypothetical protein
MNAVSTVFAAVVLAAMVAYGSCQTAAKTINCYTCTGTYTPGTGVYVGCDYPFNSTSMQTVACPGVCTKAVIFDATYSQTFSASGTTVSTYGTYDTIVRGCTVTSPPTGCFVGTKGSHESVCISTCSTDLCNSADGLRSATVALVGLVSMMAIAFSR